MSLLQVSEAYGRYGGVDILNGVSLVVDTGQIVVIVGPNGAGKSTLMKAVFGLVPIHKGEVTFDGGTITKPRHGERIHHPPAFNCRFDVAVGRGIIASAHHAND